MVDSVFELHEVSHFHQIAIYNCETLLTVMPLSCIRLLFIDVVL